MSAPGKSESKKPNTIGSVLFVCSQNVIRSPICEALTKWIYPNSIFADSAGVIPCTPDPFVEAVMEEIGVDLSNHVPKNIEHLEDTYFDLIVTLTPPAHHQMLDLARDWAGEVEYWPTIDPTHVVGRRDQIMASYRALRDSLEERIRARI